MLATETFMRKFYVHVYIKYVTSSFYILAYLPHVSLICLGCIFRQNKIFRCLVAELKYHILVNGALQKLIVTYIEYK